MGRCVQIKEFREKRIGETNNSLSDVESHRSRMRIGMDRYPIGVSLRFTTHVGCFRPEPRGGIAGTSDVRAEFRVDRTSVSAYDLVGACKLGGGSNNTRGGAVVMVGHRTPKLPDRERWGRVPEDDRQGGRT